MSPEKTRPDAERQAQILAGLRRDREFREKSYRERALKLYPHICARCGRELSGKRLRELTIHHKDHDHNNNPPDGSNWELLCLYCHDNEHEKYRDRVHYDQPTPGDEQGAPSISKPFENLDILLKPNSNGSSSG